MSPSWPQRSSTVHLTSLFHLHQCQSHIFGILEHHDNYYKQSQRISLIIGGSQKVGLANAPGPQEPERGYKSLCSWTPKTGTSIQKPEQRYKKPERGYIRTNRTFTRLPFPCPSFPCFYDFLGFFPCVEVPF